MKAVVLEGACAPEELNVQEVPIPEVKPGWVLIKIRAFGINRSEMYTRQGHSPSVQFPRIIGIECVGRSRTYRIAHSRKDSMLLL